MSLSWWQVGFLLIGAGGSFLSLLWTAFRSGQTTEQQEQERRHAKIVDESIQKSHVVQDQMARDARTARRLLRRWLRPPTDTRAD